MRHCSISKRYLDEAWGRTRVDSGNTRVFLTYRLREHPLSPPIVRTICGSGDDAQLSATQRKSWEMIMSYAAHSRDLGSFVSQPTGILRRIFDAFMEARQRDVDRQIARFLAARSRGTLTDDLEREMLAAPVDVELERECEPVRREEVPMSGRSAWRCPAIFSSIARVSVATATLRAAIASRMAGASLCMEASGKPSPPSSEHRAPGRSPACGHRPRSGGSWICGARTLAAAPPTVCGPAARPGLAQTGNIAPQTRMWSACRARVDSHR